jgi:hypothetical protein
VPLRSLSCQTSAHTMRAMSETEKAAYCRSRGIVAERHCCIDMAYAIAHPVESEGRGPNRVLDWIACWDEYIIPVAYDGYSSTQIRFCPFCSRELPASRRQQWYQTLHGLGYSNPGEQEIPDEYNSDAWWRGVG